MSNKSQYMRQIYIEGVQGTKPTFTTSTGAALEQEAKARLTPEAYGYVAGSASSETTPANNRRALDEWQIVPSMLAGIDIADFDSSTTLFGKKYPTPLIVSPIGVQSQLDEKDADLATARACAELEIPFCLSSAADRTIEEVASQGDFSEDTPGSEAWFQLYWPSDDKLTESILRRARKAGFKVLVVTLDTWILGWRPRDLNTAYNPFLAGKGMAHVLSDPYFISEYCDGKDPRRPDATEDERFQAYATAVGLLNPGISRSWEELPLLRKLWGSGPDDIILLKGIQSLTDAERALCTQEQSARIDGVVVSNHGGRQVDGALGSLHALPRIAALCRSRGKTCIFDSGVRTGSDVIKALALGAHAVGIGRPWAWGLALEGQEGVTKVLKSILADMELNAALAGCKSVSDINRHMLVHIQGGGERL
ncbi:unnamed protein product [Parajaminaea phylloscopi]